GEAAEPGGPAAGMLLAGLACGGREGARLEGLAHIGSEPLEPSREPFCVSLEPREEGGVVERESSVPPESVQSLGWRRHRPRSSSCGALRGSGFGLPGGDALRHGAAAELPHRAGDDDDQHHEGAQQPERRDRAEEASDWDAQLVRRVWDHGSGWHHGWSLLWCVAEQEWCPPREAAETPRRCAWRAGQAGGPCPGFRTGVLRLGRMGELAHVARPWRRVERAQRARRQCHASQVVALAGAGAEVRRQLGNVLAPLGERRHTNGQDLEAVEQVLAETVRCDRRTE